MFSTPPPTLPEHLRRAQALANLICHSWDDRYLLCACTAEPRKAEGHTDFFFLSLNLNLFTYRVNFLKLTQSPHSKLAGDLGEEGHTHTHELLTGGSICWEADTDDKALFQTLLRQERGKVLYLLLSVHTRTQFGGVPALPDRTCVAESEGRAQIQDRLIFQSSFSTGGIAFCLSCPVSSIYEVLAATLDDNFGDRQLEWKESLVL